MMMLSVRTQCLGYALIARETSSRAGSSKRLQGNERALPFIDMAKPIPLD
jgi:hypothetical protein